MNHFPWLIRREFWENRAIWMLPAVVGAFLILASLFGAVHLDIAGLHISNDAQGGPAATRAVNAMFLLSLAGIFLLLMSIYSAWYLLDCLYADRKDRSILFWKSLPVSDTATVLSKLSMGLIVIPLVYFAFADATSALVAFVLSVRSRSVVAAGLWHADLWLQMQAFWLYAIVTVAVWFLPVAAWLMLISAWAKKAVMLWALLPPLALILAERVLFGTRVIGDLLGQRLGVGYFKTAFSSGTDPALASDGWRLLNPAGFLSSPATWIGAVIGALLIVATIQVRMRRAEL